MSVKSDCFTMADFVANLSNYGELCNLMDFYNTVNPIIAGKIKDKMSAMGTSTNQPNDIMVLHVKEIHVTDNSERKMFRIVLVNEAALLLSNLSLRKNDFIAVRKANLIRDFKYTRDNFCYPRCVVVGITYGNRKKDIFYRRRAEIDWNCIKSRRIPYAKVVLEKKNSDGVTRHIMTPGVSSNLSVEKSNVPKKNSNSDAQALLPRSPESSKRKLVPDKSNRLQLTTSENSSSHSKFRTLPAMFSKYRKVESKNVSDTSREKCLNFVENSKSRSDEQQTVKTKTNSDSNGSLSNFIRQCREDNTSVHSDDIRILSVEIAKLNQLRDNTKVNIFAIISDVLKKPTPTAKNRMHVLIHVVDETMTDGFSVHIYFKTMEESPVLHKFNLISFQSLKIEEHDGKLEGRISDPNRIVTFDNDNPDIIYGQLQNFHCTAKGKQRIGELRKWLFENIPAARPFTPFSSIQQRKGKINVRCQVVNVKRYNNGTCFILRVSDGTECTTPFLRYPLEYDYYSKVLSEAKICAPSKEIDIIITQPDEFCKKMLRERIQAGQFLEVYNLDVLLESEMVKTQIVYLMKACLIGKSKNIKMVLPDRERETNVLDSQLPEDQSNSICNEINNRDEQQNTGKRRLFDPDVTKIFADTDDEDILKAMEAIESEPVCKKRKMEEKGAVFNESNKSGAELICNVSHESCTRPIEPTLDKSGKSVIGRVHEILQESYANTIEPAPVDEFPAAKNASADTDTSGFLPTSAAENKIVSKNLTQKKTETSSPVMNIANKNVSNRLFQITKCLQSNPATRPSFINNNGPVIQNDIENYLIQWPESTWNEAFYIQVRLLSTIPFINGNSNDFQVVSLINAHCDNCKKYFPFHCTKWVHCEEAGAISICPRCKDEGKIRETNYVLMCELLLKDGFGKIMPAVVMGCHAENLFGCTVAELCLSDERKVQVRKFLDSNLCRRGNTEKYIILKIMPIYSDTERSKLRYHVVS